jgi:5'-nucleotidase (lipoprotein e(P4) family)
MLESSLPSLFGTLFVGVLAVVYGATLIYTLCWVLDGPLLSLIARHDSKSLLHSACKCWVRINKYPTLAISAFAIIAFGVGVAVENDTDYMLDVYSRTSSYPLISTIERFEVHLLRKEDEHRFLVLFLESDKAFVLNGLGREVFAHDDWKRGAVSDWSNTNVEQMALVALDPSKIALDKTGRRRSYNAEAPHTPQERNFEAAISVVNRMYYRAKNWCYTQDNYFAELSAIQHRIDWARSVFLLSFWFVVLLLFGSALLVFRFLAIGAYKLREHRTGSVDTEALLEWLSAQVLCMMERGRLIVWTLIAALLLAAVSLSSHRHLERQFNERTFGYFSSHLSGRMSSAGSPSTNGTAIRWMSSLEYNANCLCVFECAKLQLKQADQGSSEKVVIMDVDETIVSNLGFQRRLAESGRSFSVAEWRKWVQEESDLIRAVPGAVEFIMWARESGYKVALVSNRPDDLRRHTENVLQRLGVEWDQLILATGDDRSKEAKYREIEDQMGPIAIIVGDSLADMSDGFVIESGGGAIGEGRRMLFESERARFGTKWFVIANACYGEWEKDAGEK